MSDSGAEANNSWMRRSEPRSEVVCQEVRGIARANHSRQQGPFILWDVSDHGLRLWLPAHVPTGTIMTLTFTRPFVTTVTIEVRWCRPSQSLPQAGTQQAPAEAMAASAPEGATGGFHVGAVGIDQIDRLESLHRALLERQLAVVTTMRPG